MGYSLRQKTGAVLFDVPRFVWSLRPRVMSRGTTSPWVFMRNRNERVLENKVSQGVICDWQFTSDLYLPKVFPKAGQILMQKTLSDWPIELKTEPQKTTRDVDLSFIIGHRGRSRLPHLLATLQSIAGQQDISVECILVEQAQTNEIQHELPKWVRYAHIVPPEHYMPYSRAWAFNVGARYARGRLLVFHDGDMLIPAKYGAELVKKESVGFDIVNIKRFIFYLSEVHTNKFLHSAEQLSGAPPIQVMQNAEAGGSIAIKKQSFFELGGFDEEFIGWGGEDNEFWERASTRSVFRCGYMPMVHLWHPPQPDARKINGMGENTAGLMERRSHIPPQARILELQQRKFGDPLNLDPAYEPAKIQAVEKQVNVRN